MRALLAAGAEISAHRAAERLIAFMAAAATPPGEAGGR
jgi:hypothetical protein